MEEDALAHVNGAAGVGGEGADGVVRVMRVKAAEDDLATVGFVIAIGVLEQHEVGFLGNIDALGRKLDADGQVQLVGEDGFLVRLAVAIGVFINEDLVVRQRVAGAVVRVGGHGGDPEAALVVKGELHGIGEVGEFLLAGEELGFVALGQGEAFFGGLAVEVLGAAVFDAGLVVGGHLGQLVGAAVIHGEVLLFAGGDIVNELVTEGGHLAGLFDFVGVVLRAERIVALAVGVDAIQDVVVAVPEPVLLLHGFVDEGGVGFGFAGLVPVEAGGEDFGDGLVAFVVRDKAARGERLGGFLIERLGGREEVNESEAVLFGDGLDGGGIKDEVGVFLLAVGQVALRGLIFVRHRRDEDEARGALAVVGFAEGVLHPGVEFGFEVANFGGSVEGFVVAKESDDGVSLQMGEPLVGRGEEAFAVVDLFVRVKLLRAGEGPLRDARRVGAESRGVAHVAHVAEEQLPVRVAQVQLGLDAAVMDIALGESVADQHDALSCRRWCHLLRARAGGGGRFGIGRVRATLAAVVGADFFSTGVEFDFSARRFGGCLARGLGSVLSHGGRGEEGEEEDTELHGRDKRSDFIVPHQAARPDKKFF